MCRICRWNLGSHLDATRVVQGDLEVGLHGFAHHRAAHGRERRSGAEDGEEDGGGAHG